MIENQLAQSPPPVEDASTVAADPLGTALQCFVTVALHHGLQTSIERLQREHSIDPAATGRLDWLADIADAEGMTARALDMAGAPLNSVHEAFPAIARLKNGNAVVLVGLREQDGKSEVAVVDPMARPANAVFMLPLEQFQQAWSGELLLLKRKWALTDENQPFGLRWFIPEVFKQRKLFRDIAIAALALHGLALIIPIFTQLVIDKVIVHQSYSTLTVLTAGVVFALLFDAAFSFIRKYLLLDATNRIDIRLATRTFSHLLKLPLSYFETGTAGVIVKHMQQAEKIRQFLTGRLFLTLLDASVLIVFLPVLFSYSAKLASIVLVFALLIGAVVMAMVKPFQSRLQALYNAEGERQAMLVETIQGMRTVKSLAIEPLRRRDWEQKSAQSIEMHFRVGQISNTAHTMMTLLEKLMMVTLISVGAYAVFDKNITLGALIAFNMLSGRVVSPLVQIVSLVHEYQETALSVRMLGNIMNRPVEGGRTSGGLEPQIQGKIEFEDVSFRYAPGTAPALNHLTFTIPAGKVVGVVGRSGSGKTTLTRILQGLYPVQEGVVRYDGVDIREIDLAHLRHNIGVVLQDNFLFKGTIRENIGITKQRATFDEIVNAARLAGADEFIERLPQGYDTVLEENGANLSGGQKQRLAIARALLPQPKILILDEAASALDPESEAIFLENLHKLVAGRTVIIVSHRLSTLTGADAIIVMNRGSIVDAGRHEELIKRCQIYSHLWQQQTRHL
ncbi:peptidase domain-containing ABC transporter [Janthinobacterium sp. 17J80-10]|uniref:peptidase domain-containing ABC transporter n=1 Tax=Janthinobacterium sp. 17J80-10 TaxID=2497863 RepID=UPI0010052A0A|nr:peptidase domain-containing ABC transporter [Janthinobacterium sp. 17J80-10]QAU35562.1 peptidase domain-containing ABC transporter [Janthinobacterium sp. 17J80-10]